MQAVLIMFRSDGQRRSFSISREMTVIGRRQDCDLMIPLGEVSRKHCRIIRDGDQLRLEDLGSSNGTFYNGKRVQETLLEAGDTVTVGPVSFVVQIDGVPDEDEAQPHTPDSPPRAAAGRRFGGAAAAGAAAAGAAAAFGDDDEEDALALGGGADEDVAAPTGLDEDLAAPAEHDLGAGGDDELQPLGEEEATDDLEPIGVGGAEEEEDALEPLAEDGEEEDGLKPMPFGGQAAAEGVELRAIDEKRAGAGADDEALGLDDSAIGADALEPLALEDSTAGAGTHGGGLAEESGADALEPLAPTAVGEDELDALEPLSLDDTGADGLEPLSLGDDSAAPAELHPAGEGAGEGVGELEPLALGDDDLEPLSLEGGEGAAGAGEDELETLGEEGGPGHDLDAELGEKLELLDDSTAGEIGLGDESPKRGH